jgi:ABC-type multidrug transport system fused ATPase/permease subunit
LTDSVPGRPGRLQHARVLRTFLKPYRTVFVVALLGMGLFTVLNVLPPLLVRRLMDGVVTPQLWDRLAGAVALIIIVPAVGEVVRYVNTQQIMVAARRFISDVRIRMYDRVFALTLRYHGENSAGTTVQKIMDDANTLQRLLAGDTVRLVVDGIIFVFSLTVMFTLSVEVGLILCGLLALYGLAYLFFSRRIRVATESYRATYDQIAGRLEETVSGVRQVRIYNREDWENSLFLQRTSEGLEKQLDTRMASVSLSTVCTGIAAAGSTVIAGLAAFMVLKGAITYGDYLAIMSYVWMSIDPVTRLTSMAAQLAETFVSVRRIAELLSEEPEVASPPHPVHLAAVRGRVEFQDVTFAYNAETPLYRNLGLTVEPGMTVALVGPTGCGKTTLTTLLMRHWDVQGGRILLDGVDIRELDLRELRGHFGVVLQDPVVFDGTLAYNIAYGMPHATREQVERAARAAEIHELAQSLADGYDTLVGSEGVKLSVGEKQRVGIARAILKEPAVLIMDEATSALDSHSEALIQRALERILKDRTAFVIAHRLSTITAADMIVVMDAGAIVEKGTHGDLMAIDGGLYRRLYQELLGESEGGPG